MYGLECNARTASRSSACIRSGTPRPTPSADVTPVRARPSVIALLSLTSRHGTWPSGSGTSLTATGHQHVPAGGTSGAVGVHPAVAQTVSLKAEHIASSPRGDRKSVV